MALPAQLKTARITAATAVSGWPVTEGQLEQAIADILGFTVDTDVTVSPFGCDNSGRLTKALLLQKAAAPVGHRFIDSTSSTEFRLVNDQQGGAACACLDQNTGTEGAPTWVRRAAWRLSDGVQVVGSGGGTKFTQITDSNAITNSAVETNFNKAYTIPGNTLNVGDVIRFRASYSVTGDGSHTLNLIFRVGGALFVMTGAVPSGTTLAIMEASLVVRAIGASGSLMAEYGGAGGTGGNWLIVTLLNSPQTLDTTGSLVVQPSAQWNFASVGLSVTMRSSSVEILNAASTA